MNTATRCEAQNADGKTIYLGNVGNLQIEKASNMLSEGTFFPDCPVDDQLAGDIKFLNIINGQKIEICAFEKTNSGGNYFNFHFQA